MAKKGFPFQGADLLLRHFVSTSNENDSSHHKCYHSFNRHAPLCFKKEGDFFFCLLIVDFNTFNFAIQGVSESGFVIGCNKGIVDKWNLLGCMQDICGHSHAHSSAWWWWKFL
jgi:hypothetical protein